MNQKTAFITGIAGQDGSYLAEFLLEKGYTVIGGIKRNSITNPLERIEKIKDNLNIEYCDVTDLASIIKVLQKYEPCEIYNLAAQSDVRVSFDQPVYTLNATGVSVLNVLEGVKSIVPKAKIYQASSSEMFGNVIDSDGFQRETTSMRPVSPYGCAKTYGYHITTNYRHSYNMFISNGILFNHESPRRGLNFVTNKVVYNAVRIKKGLQNELKLGNLKAARDWGHAKDYVKAMWLMLQLEKPDDFVCATGISHTVEDLVKYVFEKLNLDWKEFIKVDSEFYRPEELHFLKGDSSKAKKHLEWDHQYSFEEMLDEMIDFQLKK